MVLMQKSLAKKNERRFELYLPATPSTERALRRRNARPVLKAWLFDSVSFEMHRGAA